MLLSKWMGLYCAHLCPSTSDKQVLQQPSTRWELGKNGKRAHRNTNTLQTGIRHIISMWVYVRSLQLCSRYWSRLHGVYGVWPLIGWAAGDRSLAENLRLENHYPWYAMVVSMAMGVPQKRWFIMENHGKSYCNGWRNGVPSFEETTKFDADLAIIKRG